MSKKLPLKLCFGGLSYQFETKNQLTDWVDANMAYSVDRRQLYEALMCDCYNRILETAGSRTPEGEAESIAMLKSLKVISEKYGVVYDPDKEVFDLKEDAYKKLEIVD